MNTTETGEPPGGEAPVVLIPIETPPRGGIRVQHMMFAVGASAFLAWGAMVFGAWLLGGSLALLVAAAVGLVVIVASRGASQRESLLWALAVAAERSMPLAPAALAFADHYGRWFRGRVQLLAFYLDQGETLPAALGKVPGLLTRDAEVLVRTGWGAGRLARSLRDAAGMRSARQLAWGATAGRFLYLGGVLLVMQLLTGFMLYFILPKFEAIFNDFGIGLPQVTQVTIHVAHFVVRYFFLVAPVVFLAQLAVLAVLLVGVFESVSLWWDVPLIDSLFRRQHATVVLRALALTVAGGKPIDSGIAGLAETYPSGWVRRRLVLAGADVRAGRDWVDALHDRALIRPAEASVLDAARRLGNLEWALRETADSGDRRFGYRLRQFIQILFPLLILGMGALVFVFAVAYFTPLVRLIEALAT